jgi:hypothetical protein
MSFSPEWLTLREPVDHRSRDRALLQKLGSHLGKQNTITIYDLGTGLGSNLRAISPFLPAKQKWVLVDYDPVLLSAASEAIAQWADFARGTQNGIEAVKDGRELQIELKRHDLAANPAPWGEAKPDLVTAAALFDLVSVEWIGRFVAALASRKTAFYTALTHDSITAWKPPHPADAAMQHAFESHFGTDKGFGPSAGAEAAALMAKAFADSGYDVSTAKSPWVLDSKDKALIVELANGWASAVRETNFVPEATISEWLKARTADGTSCTVGHEDLLALSK